MEENNIHNELGKISISDDVLADLAGLTCTRCYGIVGMASQSFQEGVAELLEGNRCEKG